ncbi:MAG: hypothetical protein RMJ98_22340 [Myxococcales bacterium]|nr:hypothetical protein [Polyangiaceae bacterium]MDW8252043.1 hypothetical protein [Myxococcales bacterium]
MKGPATATVLPASWLGMNPCPPLSFWLRWLLTLGLAVSCTSGPHYDGQVYRGHGLVFRTGPVGDGWVRLEASHGLLAFRDEGARSTILVNGRCGQDGDDVPLTALTAHLFLRFTERKVDEEKLVPFDGREALHTVMTAKLDGVPMRFEVVVTKKDGCVYDFVLIASPETFDSARPKFQRFVDGFHAEPRP